MNYMGIAHHKQTSHITLLENFLSVIEEVKAVMEAGCSSYTMVDVLDDMGIEVTIQNRPKLEIQGSHLDIHEFERILFHSHPR